MANETIELPGMVDNDDGDLPDPYRFDDTDGRSKLEPDHFAPVCDVLAAGGTKSMAANAVNVTRETLMNWYHRGRENVQDDAPLDAYGAFYLHAERAMSRAKATDISAIREAGEHDWRARKWLLEQVYPDEFGARAKDRVVDRKEDDDGYTNRMTREQWEKRERNRQEFLAEVEAHVNDE